MSLTDKIRLIADGEFEVCSKLSADELTQICRDLRGVKSLLDWTTQNLDDKKSELEEVSKRYTTMVIQNSALAADNERLTEELQKQKEMTIACADELIQAASELSGIKKQQPFRWAWIHYGGDVSNTMFHSAQYAIDCWEGLSNGGTARPFYLAPVHQHSFTLSGIGTFYADSEVCITYLERLHGVGGKANLREVTDER